jgi:gibberellin 2-oxidase
MVVASPNSILGEKIIPIDLPMIDLSAEKSIVMKLIVKACEEYGFFNVINHGVPHDIISKMEEVGFDFFAKPMEQKKLVAFDKPFGYGCKNIGFNGDMGEVEYLLLNANVPSIPNDTSYFRFVYVNIFFLNFIICHCPNLLHLLHVWLLYYHEHDCIINFGGRCNV